MTTTKTTTTGGTRRISIGGDLGRLTLREQELSEEALSRAAALAASRPLRTTSKKPSTTSTTATTSKGSAATSKKSKGSTPSTGSTAKGSTPTATSRVRINVAGRKAPSAGTGAKGQTSARLGADKRSGATMGPARTARAGATGTGASGHSKGCGCGAEHRHLSADSGRDPGWLTRFSLEPRRAAGWRDPERGLAWDEFFSDHKARAAEDRARAAAEEAERRRQKAEAAEADEQVQRERRRRLFVERDALRGDRHAAAARESLVRGMSVPCDRHDAAVGSPCWSVEPTRPGPASIAVCGPRLRRAMPDLREPSDFSVRRGQPSKGKGQPRKGQPRKGQPRAVRNSAGSRVNAAGPSRWTDSKPATTKPAMRNTAATTKPATTSKGL